MLRIAVVGAGQFGQNHCRVVRQSARAELTAVVDTDSTRAAIADYRELAGKVDAAIIATPTSAHAEIGCWLLEHGIDVLVEKPIAPDPLSRGVIAISARLSTPPGTSTIIAGPKQSRLPRHDRWGFGS